MPKEHNILADIQNKLYSLENDVETQKSRADQYKGERDELIKENEQLKRKLDSIDTNNAELEQLRVENGKLLVELNNTRRDSKARQKLDKIAGIMKDYK